jgi:hypothetical protein
MGERVRSRVGNGRARTRSKRRTHPIGEKVLLVAVPEESELELLLRRTQRVTVLERMRPEELGNPWLAKLSGSVPCE